MGKFTWWPGLLYSTSRGTAAGQAPPSEPPRPGMGGAHWTHGVHSTHHTDTPGQEGAGGLAATCMRHGGVQGVSPWLHKADCGAG